ncbi:MAG: 4Fe-4S binding protein [Pseudomonadota bacterium]
MTQRIGKTIRINISTDASTTARPDPASLPLLARIGEWLKRHRSWILCLQWSVVLAYAVLVVLPVFLPLPAEDTHLWNNLTRFAQFMFWGLWWPGVMIATLTLGRTWCGVFCPEGTLTEWASRHGMGRAIPRWLKWSGWPFAAFLGTTVYGQLISVYEYPQAALLVLGGSTLAAIALGLVYGKNKRVWCRHLCPANGVFGLLAKIAPLHYKVDRARWDDWDHRERSLETESIDCAPLIDIRRMKSASECHSCGRCHGHRDAVQWSWRAASAELLDPSIAPKTTEVLTLLFGVLGVATAAFQWSSSPWYVHIKLALAEWLIDHGKEWLLQDNAPWWLLTHVPTANDVFTWLDGALILGYLIGGGCALGALLALIVAGSARLSALSSDALGFRRLALALTPLGAANIILGLSMLTVSHLKAEQIKLDWLTYPRSALFLWGALFSLTLAWRLLSTANTIRRISALAIFCLAPILLGTLWYTVFWVW